MLVAMGLAASRTQARALIEAGAVQLRSVSGFETLRKPSAEIAHDAEEAQNPTRYIPRAILISVTLCAIIYVTVALVTLGTVPWQEVNHPLYGKVEVGGRKKNWGRQPPSFLLEEECHRNMAFTLYQADEMPRMAIGETKVERLGDGVFKVWVDLVNDKAAPTILAKAAMNNVVPPDLLTLDGKGVEVLSASWVPSKWRQAVAPMIDQKDLTRIMLRNGQPGRSTRTVQYLLKGAGSISVKYASAKGGTVQKVIALQ